MHLVDRQSLTVTGLLVVARWEDLPSEIPTAWRMLFSRIAEFGGIVELPEYVEVSLEREQGIFRELVGVILYFRRAGTTCSLGWRLRTTRN